MKQTPPSAPQTWEPIHSCEHPGYIERVYSGLLGKLIGVYLGRPVENWTYERIQEEIGDVSYYIHEQRGRRLIVTDDDISGTLTFLRALEDSGFDPNLTAEQIGQTWLNYLIEDTTLLWWGGLGNSTEHTAYLRLKSGIPAPKSGSAELNSRIVAEQIGAQIFIDGWGLINPGDPGRAADFARRAASVSHDGEAVHGAEVVAAMVAQAFVEQDIQKIIDAGLEQIPGNSIIQSLANDLRDWHASGIDWRACRAKLQEHYGYSRFKGQCHLIPNHGLILLSLLYGNGNFDESMKVVNTCGWDTDCNSGNVGAILGVAVGLDGLHYQDWRGPVADRLYLPSTDGGRSISDAAIETMEIVNAARQMRGLDPVTIKNGARFHFQLSGSVQGWELDSDSGSAHQEFRDGIGMLSVQGPTTVKTPTFIPPHTKDMVTGYVLVANPTIYSGNTLTTKIIGDDELCQGRLFFDRYGPEDDSIREFGPDFELENGKSAEISWLIPDTHGYPIHAIGIELTQGKILLDHADWKGVPKTHFPPAEGTMWGRAWAKALHRFQYVRDRYEYMTHNSGVGLLIQGSQKWDNYRVSCRVTPRMSTSAGIAMRVRGLQRYYAFVFAEPGVVRLDKMWNGRKSIASVAFPWEPFQDYDVVCEVDRNRLRLFVNGDLILQATDNDDPILSGAFAFIVESGCLGAGTPSIEPISS